MCLSMMRAVRRMHTYHSKKLLYCNYGNPIDVLQVIDEKLPPPQDHQIIIEMLAAPINPGDINTIQGVYPTKPPLPAVPGNEGVGRVVFVGKDVTTLRVGDHVIPNTVGVGTWRTHGIWEARFWMKVSNKLGLVEASTLTSNLPTSYRMLKDFVDLKPGDTVIQNGSNSTCGQYVIQLCNVWDLQTVNIIRDRPKVRELKDRLSKMGATHVLTEEELRTTSLFKDGGLKPPKLALNCVGGQSGLDVLRTLPSEGIHVTYGGMSKNPVIAPTSALIFKNIQMRGFWITDWNENNHNSSARDDMLQELINLVLEGAVKAPQYQLVPFHDSLSVIQKALDGKGFAGQKSILTFCEN